MTPQDIKHEKTINKLLTAMLKTRDRDLRRQCFGLAINMINKRSQEVVRELEQRKGLVR